MILSPSKANSFMKKIVVPFEGDHYPIEVLELLRELNAQSPVMLAAAFTPEVDYAHLLEIPGKLAAATYMPVDEDAAILRNSVRLREFCSRHGIRHIVRSDRYDFALPAIRKETRFADLLMLSCRNFFANISAEQPNAYMKEILHTMECPVLLVPEAATLPDGVIFLYDGTPSSIHAIRQFIYLFPSFGALPAILTYLRNKDGERLPEEDLIGELVSQHFTDLRIARLDLGRDSFLHSWMAERPGSWLVAGSFGRSGLSEQFSRSFLTEVIREHTITSFVAHL